MTLFARVFSLLLAFSLAPLFVLATWVLRSDEAIRENVRAFHRQAAEQAMAGLEQFVAELNRELAFVADLDRVRTSGPLEEFKALQAAAANPRFMLLSVVGAGGREYLRTADESAFPGGYADRSQEPAYQAARRSGRATFGDVALAKGLPVLPLVYPLAGDRAVYLGYSLEGAWRGLEGRKVGRSGRVLAVNARGAPLPGLPALEGLTPQALGPLQGERGVIDQPAWVGAFERAPSLGWTLVSLQPRSEAFLRSGTFHLRFLLGTLGLAVLVVVASAFVTRRLTEPLEALIAGALRVGRGELDRPVAESGWGKLQDLARGFNEMMARLKAYQDLQVDKILAEKAKVETLVETMPDGVVLASLRGELEYINRPAAEVLRLAPEGDVAGRALHELISPAGFTEAFQRVLQRAEGSEIMRLRRGPETRYYRSKMAMSKVKGKQDVAVVALFQDITTERELDRIKDEMFHGIVHDLRNPLSTIIGFVELGEARGAWSEQGKKFVVFIKNALDLLQQLIDDILQLARLESGEVRLSLKDASVAELLDSVRAIFSVKAENEKKSLRIELAEPALSLECDRELLERVLMNLTGNALKFTPASGTIILRARRAAAAPGSEEGIVFGVSDTGPGIPKEQAEAIFGRFKQLEGAQKKAGFGLGLSICKRVVEMHGGRIWVESTLGVGTTFLFQVPRRQAAAAIGTARPALP